MDRVESLEQSFFDKEVLSTEYLLRYRRAYYRHLQDGWQLAFKNYESILDCLASIYENDNQYGKSYCFRIKREPGNMRSCEAIMSEAFVHSYYIPLKNEELIKSIELIEEECDLIIEDVLGDKRFYESQGYSVKVNLKTGELGSGDYDWSNNLFDDKNTKYIYAIEWFDKSDYSQRRILINWNYKGE